MAFINRPITEFYKEILTAAGENGYFWAVSVLPGEDDVYSLYSDLLKSCRRLSSKAEKYFLIIYAGKEHRTLEERWIGRIVDSKDRDFSEYNNYVTLITPDTALEHSCLELHYRHEKDRKMPENNQRDAMNALRDSLGIIESNIPYLVFTRVGFYGSLNRIIVPVPGESVIKYLDQFFREIEPLLEEHSALVGRLRELATQKRGLKSRINQDLYKLEKDILAIEEELLLQAEMGISDGRGRTLHDCMNELSYGTFDQPLRGMLNRYIDLIKGYEKTRGRSYDCNLIRNEIELYNAATEKARADLLVVEREIDMKANMCGDILAKIEAKIWIKGN